MASPWDHLRAPTLPWRGEYALVRERGVVRFHTRVRCGHELRGVHAQERGPDHCGRQSPERSLALGPRGGAVAKAPRRFREERAISTPKPPRPSASGATCTSSARSTATTRPLAASLDPYLSRVRAPVAGPSVGWHLAETLPARRVPRSVRSCGRAGGRGRDRHRRRPSGCERRTRWRRRRAARTDRGVRRRIPARRRALVDGSGDPRGSFELLWPALWRSRELGHSASIEEMDEAVIGTQCLCYCPKQLAVLHKEGLSERDRVPTGVGVYLSQGHGSAG